MSSETTNSVKLGRIAPMLPVSDIDESYRIYREVFGFRKVFENGDPVGFMILTKDDAELHLTLQKSHKAATFNVAHMLVSDAAQTYGKCQQHGLRIIKRLQDKDYGLRAFVFADPDGNRIDVGEII
ncbi:VOC family protein [Roseibium sp. MMSF_3412]|uniref:VOC family protein n=1 Tax=Roseibium sp. MMSF_3412 TaxID=3046712 RepID=UPI00273D8618|nr:VOC family protein [Roseibium sp. MMSF_3412]